MFFERVLIGRGQKTFSEVLEGTKISTKSERGAKTPSNIKECPVPQMSFPDFVLWRELPFHVGKVGLVSVTPLV